MLRISGQLLDVRLIPLCAKLLISKVLYSIPLLNSGRGHFFYAASLVFTTAVFLTLLIDQQIIRFKRNDDK